MTEENNNGSNSEPYFYPVWEKYQGRGVLAQSQGNYEEAVVQFSIAAFVLVVDSIPEARLCRAQSLVSLANAYLLLESYDKALAVLQEAMSTREGLIPLCHTLTAETLHLMANAYHGLRYYPEANQCYQQASDYLFQLLPAGHPYIKEVSANWLVSASEWNARNELAEAAEKRKSA
jgi:tetratricopeptide (TPR) repeat protein